MTDTAHNPSTLSSRQAQDRVLQNFAQVKLNTLLLILAVAPIAVMIVVFDRLFFGGEFHQFIVRKPVEIAYWAAAFSTPHIIASWLTFADREYISYYKKPLIQAFSAALFLGLTVPFVFGVTGVLLVTCFLTIYHNQQQLYGISLMMLRTAPTFDFKVWKWSSIAAVSVGYTLLLGRESAFLMNHYNDGIRLIFIFGGIALIAAIRFGYDIFKRKELDAKGKAYFIGVVFELIACAAFFFSGYLALALIVPKISHSLTAFAIYIVHEKNRNVEEGHNVVYNASVKLHIPPLLTFFAISVGTALLLCHVLSSYYAVTVIIIFLNFMHYCLEAHMWKRGAIHRKHVAFH